MIFFDTFLNNKNKKRKNNVRKFTKEFENLFRDRIEKATKEYIQQGIIIINKESVEKGNKEKEQQELCQYPIQVPEFNKEQQIVENFNFWVNQNKIDNFNKRLFWDFLKMNKKQNIGCSIKYRIVYSIKLKKKNNMTNKISNNMTNININNIYKIIKKNKSFFLNEYLIIKKVYSTELGNFYICKNINEPTKKYFIKLFYLNACSQIKGPLYKQNQTFLVPHLNKVLDEILFLQFLQNQNIISVETVSFDVKRNMFLIVFPFVKHQSMYFKKKYNIYSVKKKVELVKNHLKLFLYSENFIRSIFRKVYYIMKYCLEKNVAYLDLKPENLLINEVPTNEIIPIFVKRNKKKEKKRKIGLELEQKTETERKIKKEKEEVIENVSEEKKEKENENGKQSENENKNVDKEEQKIENENVDKEEQKKENKNIDKKEQKIEKQLTESNTKSVISTHVEGNSLNHFITFSNSKKRKKETLNIYNCNFFLHKKRKTQKRKNWLFFENINVKGIRNKKNKFICNVDASKCFLFDKNSNNIFFQKNNFDDSFFICNSSNVFMQIFIKQKKKTSLNSEKSINNKSEEILQTFSIAESSPSSTTEEDIMNFPKINQIEKLSFFTYKGKTIDFLKFYWLYYFETKEPNDAIIYLSFYFLNNKQYLKRYIKKNPQFITYANPTKEYFPKELNQMCNVKIKKKMQGRVKVQFCGTLKQKKKKSLQKIENIYKFKKKEKKNENLKKICTKEEYNKKPIIIENEKKEITFKLIDFDTCVFKIKNKSSYISGTYMFNSFECLFNINNNKKISLSKKIAYTIGCTLYVFYFGKTPFGNTIFEIHQNMKRNKVRFPKYRGINEDLKDLLKKLLKKTTKKRLNFKKIITHKWFINNDDSF